MGKKENNKKEDPTIDLRSSDPEKARLALKKIGKEGKREDIPGIVLALRLQENIQIKKEIHNLLCDIQLTGIQKYIIEAIKNPENDSILHELISICWESKQDFTKYLEVFTASFLNAEYKVSLEAFTMIEKIFLDYDYEAEKLQKTIDILKTSYADLTENKRDLALVLIDSLDNLRENG